MHESSFHLLQDLNGLLSSQPHVVRALRHSGSRTLQQGPWSALADTLSWLDQFIPRALSRVELEGLDPQQESQHTLSSLIYEELCMHNKMVTALHLSLEEMLGFLRGSVLFSAAIGRSILAIANNWLPERWRDVLFGSLHGMESLLPIIKLLRARVEFYTRTLQSGTLPTELSVIMFSCPEDLLSRLMCGFAVEYQIPVSSIVVRGSVSGMCMS